MRCGCFRSNQNANSMRKPSKKRKLSAPPIPDSAPSQIGSADTGALGVFGGGGDDAAGATPVTSPRSSSRSQAKLRRSPRNTKSKSAVKSAFGTDTHVFKKRKAADDEDAKGASSKLVVEETPLLRSKSRSRTAALSAGAPSSGVMFSPRRSPRCATLQ